MNVVPSQRRSAAPGSCTYAPVEVSTGRDTTQVPNRVADDGFDHPRIAAIYDALDGDRSDLEAYVQMAEERGARRVLDVGCGTGTFALLLADRGLEVTGVDLRSCGCCPGWDRRGRRTALAR